MAKAKPESGASTPIVLPRRSWMEVIPSRPTMVRLAPKSTPKVEVTAWIAPRALWGLTRKFTTLSMEVRMNWNLLSRRSRKPWTELAIWNSWTVRFSAA